MNTLGLIILIWLVLIAFFIWFFARLYFRTDMLEERCRYHWGEIHSLFKKIISEAEQIKSQYKDEIIDWKEWDIHKENADNILKMSPAVFADEWLMKSFIQAQNNFFSCKKFYFEKYKDIFNQKDKEIFYGLQVQLITLFQQYNRASETYQKQRKRILINWFCNWWFWKNYKAIEIEEKSALILPEISESNLFSEDQKNSIDQDLKNFIH